MKIVAYDCFGDEHTFEIIFEDVTPEQVKEKNKETCIGWPKNYYFGILKLGDKTVYETKTYEISGCSYSRRNTKGNIIRDCMNYFIDNYI